MDFTTFSKKIAEAFKKHLSLDLTKEQVESFYIFMNLLIEKNKVMNLTAITEPDEIIVRHFVDSCMAVKLIPFCNNNICEPSHMDETCKSNLNIADAFPATRSKFIFNFFENKYLVDIGTGAGFPGLPLSIICDKAKFVLTDTLGKRINFLSEVVSNLKIKNVDLIKSRAEDFCHDKYFREKFDYALSRGVAKLSVLSEYSLPAIKVGGQMISFKMDDIEIELSESKNAIRTLGGMFHVKHSYSLIKGEPDRSIIIINKISKTPKVFPRKAGTPSKAPL